MHASGWAALGVLLFSAPAVAVAQPSNDAEARARFQAGEAAYARGDYPAALEDFERSYTLSQRPGLLFNIGLAAQRARRRERALEAFQEYLRLTPEASNRADVESRIAELEELLGAQRMREQQQTPPGPDTPPTGGTPDEPIGDDPVVDEPVDDGGEGPGALPWIVIGGSGAVLVTGVVLFAMAQSDIATVEDVEMGATWSEIEGAYDRAPMLSTIGLLMIGAGVAGATVGIVLLAGGSGGGETSVALAPGGAVLRGSW
jgi:tetratricopeptide (TPR) repeat protein